MKQSTYFLFVLANENVLVVDHYSLQKVFCAGHILIQQTLVVRPFLFVAKAIFHPLPTCQYRLFFRGELV